MSTVIIVAIAAHSGAFASDEPHFAPAEPKRAARSNTPRVSERALARRTADAQAPLQTSDPSRLIFGESGFGQAAGGIRWESTSILLHRVEYAPSDHVEIGLTSWVPIGSFAVLPQVKFSGSPASWCHLALSLNGGVFGTYLDPTIAYTVGAGAFASFGSERLFLNVGVQAGALVLGRNGFSSNRKTGVAWYALPTVGFSWRINRRVRLSAELHSALAPWNDRQLGNGKVWTFSYGLRIFGDHLFGDVAFLIPIFDGAQDLLKYLPTGIPLLSLGYRWD